MNNQPSVAGLTATTKLKLIFNKNVKIFTIFDVSNTDEQSRSAQQTLHDCSFFNINFLVELMRCRFLRAEKQDQQRLRNLDRHRS